MSHPFAPDDDGCFTLRLHAPEAQQVNLAGDFNGWSTTAHPMEAVEGGWWQTRTPPLRGGQHTAVRVCYKFVVDEDQWLADPANPWRVRADSALYVPADEPTPPTEKGKVLTGAVYVSRALGRPCRYLAYLPAGYERHSQRLPVLYLLHGYNDGGATDWLLKGHLAEIADTLIELGRIPPMIIVLPEAGDGFYADRFDGSWPLERALAHDLVRHVDTSFRTRANRRGRAIGGISAGGFGAMKLALQYPHFFCSVHSHAGFFDVQDPGFFPEIFGEGPASALHRRWNSPIELIREPPRTAELRMSFDCGESDHLFPDNVQFQAAVADRAIPHEFWTTPGFHTWDVVQRTLPRALESHGRAFRGDVPLKGSPGAR